MPVSGYYKGDGNEVMAGMVKRYGAKKGKQIFYATANKKKLTPPKKAHGRPKGRLKKKHRPPGKSDGESKKY